MATVIMTRDEAKAKLLAATDNKCTERWMDDFIDSAAALGLLIVKVEKPSLWQILRKHDVPLDRAQWICNDALNAGYQRGDEP